jgi:predicted nuclease with TOPRIM domain
VASEKTNGHDPTAARMVELLEGIQGELQGLRGEVRATNQRLDTFKDEVVAALIEIHHDIADTNVRISDTNERFDRLTGEVHQTNERLDRLNGEVRETNDHGARIVALEKAVFKRTG